MSRASRAPGNLPTRSACWGRGLRSLLCFCALTLAGCRIDASFKLVDFDPAEYDSVFEVCKEQIRLSYLGVVIRADPATGLIETDPVLFNSSKGLRREQAFVQVKRGAGRRMEVAVFAPMSRQEVDPDAQPPVRWVALGSDVKQERRLLDAIIGAVVARFPEAQVFAGG